MNIIKKIQNKGVLFLLVAVFFFLTTLIFGWSFIAFTFTNKNIESKQDEDASFSTGVFDQGELVDVDQDGDLEKVMIKDIGSGMYVLNIVLYEKEKEEWIVDSEVLLFSAGEVEHLETNVLWNQTRYEIIYKIPNQEMKSKVLVKEADDYKLYDKGEAYVNNGVAYYENIRLYKDENVIDKIDVAGFGRDEIVNKLKEKTGYFLTSLLKKNDLSDTELTVVNDEIVMYDDCYGKGDRGFFLPIVDGQGKLIVITNCYDSYGVDSYSFSVNDVDIIYNDYKYVLASPCLYNEEEATVDHIFFNEHFTHKEVIDFARLKDWSLD